MGLTDEQWSLVESILPESPRHDHGGRPRASRRSTLDGILWIMRTGAPWSELPPLCPSRRVCQARFREWAESGTLSEILSILAMDLEYRLGLLVDDQDLQPPESGRDRASWWWQTVLLLNSPDAKMVSDERSDRPGGSASLSDDAACLACACPTASRG